MVLKTVGFQCTHGGDGLPECNIGVPNPCLTVTANPGTPPELLEPPTRRARQASTPLLDQGANVEIFLRRMDWK